MTATGWIRNYGAMKPEKLATCIAELEEGTGDAVARVENHDGSVERNLAAARQAARLKGMTV